jgi:hypothetical protein
MIPNMCLFFMFCNLYLVKNHKVANNSTITEAIETVSTIIQQVASNKSSSVLKTQRQNTQTLQLFKMVIKALSI